MHLEDNEEIVLDDDLAARRAAAALPVALLDTIAVTAWRSHPVRAGRFVDGAAG